MADFNSGRYWRAYASTGTKNTPEQQKTIDDLCDKWRIKGLTTTDRIGGWPGGYGYVDEPTRKDPSVNMLRLVDPTLREVFEAAQAKANEQSQEINPSDSPQVDPFLHMGGLYTKTCGIALELATNEVIFPPDSETISLWEKYKIDYIAIHYAWSRTYLYWSPEKTKKLAKDADWKAARAKIEKKGKAAVVIMFSARAFLEACAETNRGIRFAAD